MPVNYFRPVGLGFLAAGLLLIVYFSVLTAVSGWSFAQTQFQSFWYFIVSLAAGFGAQVGLYVYLKTAIHDRGPSGKVLAVSGTTSTAAMISCCTHYLVNILPVLGVSGLLGIIGQYQTEIFWVGLIFNLFGIVYIGNKVFRFKRQTI